MRFFSHLYLATQVLVPKPNTYKWGSLKEGKPLTILLVLPSMLGLTVITAACRSTTVDSSIINSPPWLETWWLYGGIFVLVIFGFAAFFVWQYRRLKDREKHLDLELSKRTQELSYIQSQMNILFHNSPLGIGLASLDGKIMSANPAMASLFGYSEEELNQAYVQDFFITEDQRLELLQRLETEKTIQVNQLQLQRKDGSKFYVNLTESRITWGSEEVLLGVVQDITSVVRAEQVLKTEAERKAVAEERKRLSRELHDSVTQSLYTTGLILEALPEVWESHPEEARESLYEIQRINRGALAEMRTLLLELRPDTITDRPLGDLLRQLTEAVSARADLPIVVSTIGDCPMPNEVQVSLYRIAQESLNNIIKHAQASKAWVNLHCSHEKVVMRVQDNGSGFDARIQAPHKLGLNIIRDRAKDIGADLTITSQPGEGTQIQVKWRPS